MYIAIRITVCLAAKGWRLKERRIDSGAGLG